MRTFRSIQLIGVALVQLACSEPATSPGSPSGTGGPLRIVTSVDVLIVGESVQLTLNRTVPSINWSTTAPSVATVDPAGRLVGRSNGQVLVLASSGGESAILMVRVAPRFAGDWQGSYAITKCERKGGFEILNLCSALMGKVSVVTWSAKQNKLVVNSAFSLGNPRGVAQGSVGALGSLAWSGSRVEPSDFGDIAVSMTSDDSTVSDTDFTGTTLEKWTLPDSPGFGEVTSTFTMTPVPPALPSGALVK